MAACPFVTGPAFLFRELSRLASDNPGASALLSATVTLDRAAVVERIAALAERLLAAGVVPGELTGVTLADEIDHVLVTMALMCLATPSLNLPTHESLSIRAETARKMGIRRIVTRDAEAVPAGTQALCPPLSGPYAASEMIRRRLDATAAASLDRLFYRSTSGTTGAPKTFGVTMAVVLNRAAAIRAEPGAACVLRDSSVEYDSSRFYRVAGLLAGNCGAFLDHWTLDRLGPFCTRAGVTEIHCGTYRLASWMSEPPSPAERLPAGLRLLSGRSRVPGALRRQVQARMTRELWVFYATSETGPISRARPEDHDRWPEGIGWPEPGVEVSLRDGSGREVPEGDIGVVWVRKPGVKPDAGGQPQWHDTGDLAAWAPDGPLIFHGRADDMIILNGINIYPGAIEDCLECHPAVAEAVAFGRPSAVHGQIPVAVVRLRSGASADPAELLRFARLELGLQGPRQITLADTIPRTALGKPLRRVLQAAVSDPSR